MGGRGRNFLDGKVDYGTDTTHIPAPRSASRNITGLLGVRSFVFFEYRYPEVIGLPIVWDGRRVKIPGQTLSGSLESASLARMPRPSKMRAGKGEPGAGSASIDDDGAARPDVSAMWSLFTTYIVHSTYS